MCNRPKWNFKTRRRHEIEIYRTSLGCCCRYFTDGKKLKKQDVEGHLKIFCHLKIFYHYESLPFFLLDFIGAFSVCEHFLIFPRILGSCGYLLIWKCKSFIFAQTSWCVFLTSFSSGLSEFTLVPKNTQRKD